MGSTRDPIAVVEACYQRAGSEEDWLSQVTRAMKPLIRASELGTIAYHVDIAENGRIRLKNAVQVDALPAKHRSPLPRRELTCPTSTTSSSPLWDSSPRLSATI